MADKEASKYNLKQPGFDGLLERTKNQKSYFFLEGRLYKLLREIRPTDMLVAQDMETKKVCHFILSDAKRKMKNAYDTIEVARMLNRTRSVIQTHVLNGAINPPIMIHTKGKNMYGHPFGTRKWSEEDVIALHEHLLTVGAGRPRKDGILYPGTRLPSRKELIAMLRNTPMFYMRTASGEFVPVWSAQNEI
jgi:hypothetical protein